MKTTTFERTNRAELKEKRHPKQPDSKSNPTDDKVNITDNTNSNKHVEHKPTTPKA